MFVRDLLLALGVTACALDAQIDPNVGAPIGGVSDDTVTAVALSFPMPVAGGASVSQFFVDSNGRLLFATDFSDLSESVTQLLNGVGQFAVYWDDLHPTALGGNIHFNDLGTSALLTWVDTTLFGGAQTFTFQVELYPSGVVAMRYDNRMPAFTNDGLTGVSPGGGVADPGSSNLSAGARSFGDPTIYEVFLSTNNDLIDGELVFTPDGIGGYDVVSTIVDLVPASIDLITPGCDLPGPTLTFTPNLQGGYDLSVGGSIADPDFALGTTIPLGEDEVRTVVPSRSVVFPGGVSVNQFYVDSNGRVISAPDTSDFFESVADLLSDPSQVAVLWDDLSPVNGGSVWYHETGTGVSVTWDRVPEFFSVGENSAQVFFGDDGRIVLSYLGVTSQDSLVGLSAGSGIADPGEIDLSAGSASTSVPIVYELFTGDFDLVGAVPHLSLSATPILGQTLDVAIQTATDTPFAQFFMLGGSTFVPIESLGGPDCALLCDGSILTLGALPGTNLGLTLPVRAGLRGVSLRIQGATFEPGSGFPFWVFFTEAFDITLGDF